MDALPQKNAPKKVPWWMWVLRGLGLTAAVALVFALMVVVVNDIANSRTVPSGVQVHDLDLGGMTLEQTNEALDAYLRELSAFPLTIRVGETDVQVALGTLASFDKQRLIDEVGGVRPHTPIFARIRYDWTGEPLPPRQIEVHSIVNKAAIRAFVEDMAERYDATPKKAELEIGNDYSLRIIPDVKGVVVSKTAAVSALIKLVEKTVAAGRQTGNAEIPILASAATVTAESLGKKAALVVSLSQRRIYLYKGDELVKTYRCAVGSGGFPTPRGDFKIEAKRYMPTWSNPGSGWAKDMPRTIPPGYSNPLGVRALNLNVSGIRIHGTNNIGSIGSAASHGCMRVANGQIIDLYDRVKVGTPVYIRY